MIKQALYEMVTGTAIDLNQEFSRRSPRGP
jgi:hypothetical protein